MNNKLIMRSLPMVASVLGRKYGVKVEIGGKQAYTDGSTIHMPSLPIDENKDFTSLIRGWLDHEAAHIRFTDFEGTRVANLSPLEIHITNILEDWRIEREMVKRYPGCRMNLNYMIKYHFSSQPPISKNPIALILNYILLFVRSWETRELCRSRDAVGYALVQTLSKLAGDLDLVLAEAWKCINTTADCIEYARRIVQLIEKERERKDVDKKSTTQNGQSNSESTPCHDNPPDNSDSEVESGNDSESKQSQNESKNNGHSPSEASRKGLNEQSVIDSTGQEKIGGEEVDKALEKLLNIKPDELPEDMSQSIASQLESASPSSSRGLTVATEADKDVRSLSQGEITMVKRTSTALHTRLHSLLQTTTLSRRQPGRRGRLDTSRLYKAAYNPKIFQMRAEKQGINTAVHILLDCSGSMRNRMTLAGQTCFATADSLTRIDGVSIGVTAFPAGLNKQAGNRITVKTLLDHGQKMHGGFNMNATGNTPMGEALWYVMQKMIPLKENRKMILIVTDGQASNATSAEKAIENGKQFGFEFYGIGIVDRYIEQLLPDSNCIIKEMPDLAPAMFSLLQNALLQQY